MTLHIMHVNLAKGFRGGERQTELLIQSLAARGFKQSLVCRSDSPLRHRLQNTERLAFINANHQLMGHWQAEADIVHAHEAKAVHWAWLHHCLKGTPYILTRRVPQQVKDSLFNRWCYSKASMAVAISSPIEKHLQSRHWCPVSRIPSALAHLKQNSDQVSELKVTYAGHFIIGHAGALVDKHKGQRELIAAARLLAKEIPEAIFLMLGDGPDKDVLQAESQDMTNIKWLGFKSNLGDYLSILDLFAFPSRNEGLGSTLLDVMDYNVPIVASAVDGIPDIVRNEETGLLVPPNDASSLARAILQLYKKPQLRIQLAQNAKAELQQYAPEMMAERYSQLYQSLITH